MEVPLEAKTPKKVLKKNDVTESYPSSEEDGQIDENTDEIFQIPIIKTKTKTNRYR